MTTDHSASDPVCTHLHSRLGEAQSLLYTDPARAIATARTAFDEAQRAGETLMAGHSLYIIGVGLHRTTRYIESLDTLRQALGLLTDTGDEAAVALVLHAIATHYLELGDNSEALHFLVRAEALANRAGALRERITCLTAIAGIYEKQSEAEGALALYAEAAQLAEQTDDLETAGTVYRTIGITTHRIGRRTEAEHALRRALALQHRSGNRSALAVTLDALGSVFADNSEMHRALRYYMAALRLHRTSDMPQQRTATHAHLSVVLATLGDTDRALAHAREGLAVAEAIGASELALHLHRRCAALGEQQGDVATAMRHLHSALDIATALAETHCRRTVSLYEIRLETGRRHARQQELLRRLCETEHDALRAQMNPHFISNALAAIQSLVVGGDIDEAHRYLSLFARLIRRLFDQTRSNYIPLEDELDTLRLYLHMEKLRFEHRFDFSITIVPPLLPSALYVPPLLLQPLAENALVHGILPSVHTGALSVAAQYGIDGSLRCTVLDNGIGIGIAAVQPKRPLSGGRAQGLTLLRERLELLAESTGKPASLNIDEQLIDGAVAGTRAELLLPALSQAEVTALSR